MYTDFDIMNEIASIKDQIKVLQKRLEQLEVIADPWLQPDTLPSVISTQASNICKF